MTWYMAANIGEPPHGWREEPEEGYIEVGQEVRDLHEHNPGLVWDGVTLVSRPESGPYVPTAEEIIAGLTAVVQTRLDEVARAKNYDGMQSLRAAKGSVDPEFDVDGTAGDAYWAGCWRKCYAVMADVQAGLRGIPTADELLAEMPQAPW